MKADSYYGARVRTYDADRCNSLRWAREQGAVADFVTEGPVLDCPLGTGRYVGIYRDKGLPVFGADISDDMLCEALRKYPDLSTTKASIFELPYRDGAFATAVCTRMLDWLSPGEMQAAVAELRRVARTLVVSIRHGRERVDTNQTHDLARFYRAIDGLFIAERRVTEEWHGDVEEVFLCRPPVWEDVLKQFEQHGCSPEHELHRLACEWFGHIELDRDVRAEYWPADRLWNVIEGMAARHDETADPHDRYIISQPPRGDGPLTIMEKGGEYCVLDGRRRINSWRGRPGLFPVLLCPQRS